MIYFKLRPLTIDDAFQFARHANNLKIASNLTDQFPHPYTLAHAKEWIESVNKQDPRRILTIDINGEACGAVGLHEQMDVYCKNVEMGYWLSEEYWGQGIMTEAIKQMVTYGFKHFDITRIFARPYGDNLASQRVLEKAGFTLEAKLIGTFYKQGEFKDELIYAIRVNKN